MWVGLGCEGNGKGRQKICFSAGRAAHVHYFKNIRQGALQSECVMHVVECTVEGSGGSSHLVWGPRGAEVERRRRENRRRGRRGVERGCPPPPLWVGSGKGAMMIGGYGPVAPLGSATG